MIISIHYTAIERSIRTVRVVSGYYIIIYLYVLLVSPHKFTESPLPTVHVVTAIKHLKKIF